MWRGRKEAGPISHCTQSLRIIQMLKNASSAFTDAASSVHGRALIPCEIYTQNLGHLVPFRISNKTFSLLVVFCTIHIQMV